MHACVRSQCTDNRMFCSEKEYDDEMDRICTMAVRTMGQVEKDESDVVGEVTSLGAAVAQLVLSRSGLVRFFHKFCEPRTGP